MLNILQLLGVLGAGNCELDDQILVLFCRPRPKGPGPTLRVKRRKYRYKPISSGLGSMDTKSLHADVYWMPYPFMYHF